MVSFRPILICDQCHGNPPTNQLPLLNLHFYPVFGLEEEHGHVRGVTHHVPFSDGIAAPTSHNCFKGGCNIENSNVNGAEGKNAHQVQELLVHLNEHGILVQETGPPGEDVAGYHHLLRGYMSVPYGKYMSMEEIDTNTTLFSKAKSSKEKSSKSGGSKASKKSKKTSAKSKAKKSKKTSSKSKSKKSKKTSSKSKSKKSSKNEPKCRKKKKPKCKKDKCTISTLTCIDNSWFCEHTPKTCEEGFTCKSYMLSV